MAEPSSREQFEKRYAYAQQVTGEGAAGVTMHMPCPFCASRDWKVFRVIESESALAQESTCEHCGRSGRCLVQRDAGGVQMEFVQTGGEDPPEWARPWPRRISEEG